MIQPKKQLVKPNVTLMRPQALEDSMERYKLLRASAIRRYPTNEYVPDLRTPEQIQMDYQYLRDSAKPNFNVDSGYRPDLRTEGEAILDYSKVRNNGVASYAKGGKISKKKIPNYASGGQMLQTAGGVASMIPGYGTVIGAGLNIVGGLMNSADAEKDAKRIEEERMQQYLAQQRQQDQLALEDYNIQGETGVQYYARGGVLPNSASNGNPTIGGDLIPLDNETELVVGNKHSENNIDGQYGVTLSDANGQPNANVEDQEVIKDGNYVFSDRLKSSNGKTFANRIKNLTAKKVKIEDKAKISMSNRHTDGYNRMLEGIELQEQQLQEEQEFVKMLQPNNTQTFANGGTINGDGILPEIGNTLLEESDVYGLYDSFSGNKPYKPSDILGVIPSGVSQLTSLTLRLAEKEKQNMKSFNSKANRGKVLRPRPLPLNPKVRDTNFKDGGFLPKYADGGGIKPAWMEDELLYPDNIEGSVPIVPVNNTTVLEPESEVEPEVDNRFINNLAPSLIDNVGNAIINSSTPKLPRPILARARNLDTRVNVNPQLSAITEGVESTVRDIQGNTSNSNIARANMASARLQGMKAKAGIYANKEAQERAIKNTNTQNLQTISNTNAGTLNQAGMLNFQRANEIQSRTSANLANLSSDIGEAQTRTELDTYYDESMLLSLLDDKTGAKMRAMENNPYFAKNPKLRNAIKREVERRKLINSKTS